MDMIFVIGIEFKVEIKEKNLKNVIKIYCCKFVIHN